MNDAQTTSNHLQTTCANQFERLPNHSNHLEPFLHVRGGLMGWFEVVCLKTCYLLTMKQCDGGCVA